jgi:hypothetical protein
MAYEASLTPVHLPESNWLFRLQIRRITVYAYTDWRSDAQPVGLTHRNFGDAIQLSKTAFEIHTSTGSLLGQSELDKMLQITLNNKKAGGPFLVAARFLKPVCYSKTVRSPRARHG